MFNAYYTYSYHLFVTNTTFHNYAVILYTIIVFGFLYAFANYVNVFNPFILSYTVGVLRYTGLLIYYLRILSNDLFNSFRALPAKSDPFVYEIFLLGL